MSALLKTTHYMRTTFSNLSWKALSLNTKHFDIQSRTFGHVSWFNQQLPRPVTSQAKEQQYQERDKVPSSYQLIYRAPMESYVAWSMNVSSLTATIIGGAALYQFSSNQPLLDTSVTQTTLVMHAEDIYYFALGFLAINSVLRLVVSKFPLRIYKNEGKYLAVYHSQLPGSVSQHHFNQGDVKEVSYIFSPWNGATYKLGNKTSLLLEQYFKTPSEFQQIMTTPKKD
uniref:Transmembrane protein 186 n=1 Tax=Stomoxys calcitrans TaxID=35570 RepID=A0A1I8P380_STOCA|nr:unnamed protein product [Stomoxys calcitrans]